MDKGDLMEAKFALGNPSLTQYEVIKLNHMNRRPSGIAIAGLIVGVGAVVATAGVAAWATAKASEARKTAAAENAGTAALLNRLASQYDVYMATERQERIAGDLNITNTINDTVSGSQQGQLSQAQQLSNELTFGLMTGRYSENPQRVALYQDARPCACPQSNGCPNQGY